MIAATVNKYTHLPLYILNTACHKCSYYILLVRFLIVNLLININYAD